MTVEKIALRVQNKRMTQKEWQSSFLILLDGEIGVESDTGYLKVGNGKNRYVDLPYLTGPQGAKGQDGNVKFEELSEGQLESLRGPQGVKGDRGMRGPKGDKGDKGEPGKNGGIHTHEISEITGLTGKLNDKADKSVAQMWKMTQDLGYGQVKICPKNPEDINETALFFANGGTNLPPTPFNYGPYWYILGFRASDWGRLLVAFHNTTGTIYMKQKNGGWSDWKKIPTIGDLSKKADINKAQMWKLTQDDGKTLRNDGEDVTQFNKCAFFKGTNLKNLPNGFTDFCLTQVIGDVSAHSTWLTDLSSNKIAIKTNLSDWKELATTDTTANLEKQLNSSGARITELENQVKILTAKLDRVIADGA